MRKRMLLVGFVFVLAMAWSMNAFAGGENCPIHGVFNSIGGFLYNALPWNWGNWFGK